MVQWLVIGRMVSRSQHLRHPIACVCALYLWVSTKFSQGTTPPKGKKKKTTTKKQPSTKSHKDTISDTSRMWIQEDSPPTFLVAVCKVLWMYITQHQPSGVMVKLEYIFWRNCFLFFLGFFFSRSDVLELLCLSSLRFTEFPESNLLLLVLKLQDISASGTLLGAPPGSVGV